MQKYRTGTSTLALPSMTRNDTLAIDQSNSNGISPMPVYLLSQ